MGEDALKESFGAGFAGTTFVSGGAAVLGAVRAMAGWNDLPAFVLRRYIT